MRRALFVLAMLCLAPSLAQAQAAAPDPAAGVGEAAPAAQVPEQKDDVQPAVEGQPSSEEGAARDGAAPPPQTPTELEAAAFPSTDAAFEATMTADELDALGIDTAHAGLDTSIQFSGFADFSVATQLTPKTSLWRSSPAAPPRSTFFLGNFNLYIKKNLTESLRTMGEVRFTYLPNGVVDPLERTRQRTTVPDYNDYGRDTNWGGIEIERMYLEWTAHPLVLIRAGQYLTPYGIWNVDHGSPTYIPVQRPFVVGLGWFPERQTGFEVFGRWDANVDHALGYHLTLSNGTGPVSEYLDLDENKALGGRAYWEYNGLGQLRIGASMYYGRHTDAISGYFVAPDGNETRETINQQYDALAFAADLLWTYRGLHIQSEWISFQRAYTDRGRVAQSDLGRPEIPADAASWGMYGLVGYRFSWLGIMPFAVVEHIDSEDRLGGIFNITLQGGLNIRPVDALALKLVYYHVRFLETTGTVSTGDPLRLLQAQAAWAF